MIKFSFILPVYKVEAYLRECVNSIVCQTYKNFEIILVDDGSPDGCPELCNLLATEDSRIRVLHKPNGGLSDARNAGLHVAVGDYVIFVDSDDMWIGEDSLERLARIIEQYPQCQFYVFNCQYYYPNNQSCDKWVPYAQELLTPVNGSMALISLVSSGTMPMSAWLKVIDRRWLLYSKITFKIGQIAEDIPWFINLLDKCMSCVFVNDYIYAYRQGVAGSITASGGERSFNSVLDIIYTELELIDKRSFTHEAKNSLRSFLAYELCLLIAATSDLPRVMRKSVRAKLKNLCWLMKYTQNPKVRMVSKVYDLLGYAMTEGILRIFLWYKSIRKRSVVIKIF